MNTALDPVNALFDAVFQPMATPRDPYDVIAEDDAKREAHVAKVLPDLIRLFSVTPERIADGVDHVSMYLVERHPALVAAIAHRDEAEIGRLLLVGIDARIKTLAEDAADDDGYRVVPERPL